ncbi:MAG: RNA methyltransferase [Bacteroidota bacterium]
MLSNKDIKLINSLSQKKFRQQFGLFVVEGKKGIEEFLNSDFELKALYATLDLFSHKYTEISEGQLKKISQLKTPNNALALFKIPAFQQPQHRGLILAMDDVRDPGNLGTIIRLCDWFGIEQLICSLSTVDCYNPKVVQATMGSLTRVRVKYLDLEKFLLTSGLKVFGTFMDGKTIYKTDLPKEGIIVMGNEANGISLNVEKLINERLGIPRYGRLKSTESLNVATATAIVLSEFKRNVQS